MKFEVHDKQYYIVNKVEKGAAGKNFTIFIVKTVKSMPFSAAGEIFFRRDENFNFLHIFVQHLKSFKNGGQNSLVVEKVVAPNSRYWSSN